MKLKRVILHHLEMPLKAPFQTSFVTLHKKDFLLVEVHGEDAVGYGEVTAMPVPLYNEETTGTARHILKEFAVPMLAGRVIVHPSEVSTLLAPIRRNNMAKAAIEGAIWDLWAKEQAIPLARALGSDKDRIAVGVSVGVQETPEKLVDVVGRFLDDGYQRIKVKIMPGKDVEYVRALRQAYGDILLMADANSAYTLGDMDVMKALDEFNLLMIEQPLSHDDIIQHAKLQAQLQTPICLDESIHTLEDAENAIELGSCRIINIKVGRVGGLEAVRRIHDFCASKGVPVWCGGMLEAGVGRAHNIALTTLPNFTLPGDTSASARYWEMDIIEPEVTMTKDGFIEVPKQPGIGFTVVDSRVKHYLLGSEVVL